MSHRQGADTKAQYYATPGMRVKLRPAAACVCSRFTPRDSCGMSTLDDSESTFGTNRATERDASAVSVRKGVNGSEESVGVEGAVFALRELKGVHSGVSGAVDVLSRVVEQDRVAGLNSEPAQGPRVDASLGLACAEDR